MVNLLKNKTAYKITCIAVLFFIFLRPVIILFSHTDSYFARNYSTRYENFRKEYYSSQYVTKNNPGFIPDQALENFAAGAFLQGVNPIMIIHDQPPLGRYIGALSILIFDNAETINVFLIALSGLVIFLIAKLILKNTLLSLLCSAIFVNEPLFMGQFSYLPLLESTQLPFIFLTIYFFLKALGTKKPFKLFITVSVILGFVISIRFFALGVSLLAAFVVCLFLYKEQRKKILQFLVTLPLTVLVLFLSYTKTILDGTPIWHIFGIQKYIFIYHKDQISSPFSFWDLLLFNRWHTWWANRAIAHDEQ
ncbi:MAG TPA: glycosyltransferase family 39 protein, partial [Candidatus Saccharimonadales bacterium]|nr:glycosyltransferase family 39 protein [Candidatus Saccharimonadales bacterium]